MISPLNGGGGSPEVTVVLEAPVLDPIIPSPDIDGRVNLKWSRVDIPSYLGNIVPVYTIQRSKDGEPWVIYAQTGQLSYSDPQNLLPILENGVYRYRVKASKHTSDFYAESAFSNIESVVIGAPVLPSNPSIIINDGAETTDSLTVTLTLDCDNAEEMSFRISLDTYLDWIPYTTTHTLMLLEDDPARPDYRVGVVFRNEDGESKDVFDEITYEGPSNGDGNGDENGDENGDDKPTDYTLVYILVGVLGGLIGIGIFLKYRK